MKFIVPVNRIGYRRLNIEVEAPDRHLAKKLALSMAPDMYFPNEHDAEYGAEGAMEVSSEDTSLQIV